MKTLTRYSTLLMLIVCWPALATEPARVLPLGTFHFQDAGLDAAKVEDFNVMAQESQAYLETLTQRLADFRPTAVLLEFDPANSEEMNQRYKQYLDGKFVLPTNEIYQLGFRIARKANLAQVHSFDHREVPWDAEALFEYGEANSSPELDSLQQAIAKIEKEEREARAMGSLSVLLAKHNDPEKDRQNMDLYLLTNPVGANDGWSGADAAASWWHRNFRMYAIIQEYAQPGARLIVIGGSGHMAIIKSLLAIDQRIETQDPRPYLGDGGSNNPN